MIEDERKETRAKAKRESPFQPESGTGSETSSDRESSGSGEKAIRLGKRVRQIRVAIYGIGAFTGGIIEQTLEQLKERLREYDDCIVWYVQAKQKALKQIEAMEKLQTEFAEKMSQFEEE
ncbi:MAG: hypothetical protein ACRC8A_13250 [Microcoleaceae cyanobacterium]